ncbi:hypothetical protein J437_LFUL009828 [Ladona fulva]|uniref:Codanin-1 C-terminal domain-containing protein n=1 Tax=Ladona fulva TaxID=123851 RepID=A0A8K0K8A4_LADFU|nr:hypothetical protein J437_LFUL009828 [Ladona fulva]
MAAYVDSILSGEVEINHFLRWLAGCEELVVAESKQGKLPSSRYDFALCFINYLREDASSILSNDCAKKTSAKAFQISGSSSSQNNAEEKPVVLSDERHDESISSDTKKPPTRIDVKTPKSTVIPSDLTSVSAAIDKKLHLHNSFRGKVLINKAKDGCHQAGTALDGMSVSHSPSVSSCSSRKDSPRQRHHPMESTVFKDCRSPESTVHNCKSGPREEWSGKNYSNTTLWDYVSKDNSLNLKKKDINDGQNDDKGQEKKFGAKLSGKQKRQRRINPTRVDRNHESVKGYAGIGLLQQDSVAFGQPQEVPPPGSAFCSRSTEGELKPSNFAEERALLKEERLKMQSAEQDSSISSPPKAPCSISRCSMEEPQLNLVTYKMELEILANIFSNLINLNLVPNVLSELCFLGNLLMVRYSYECHTVDSADQLKKEGRKCFFESVHNCVYFAVTVLETQSHLLQLLDRNTRRIIAENSRLTRFSQSLSVQILEDESSARSEALVSQISSLPSASTSFQSDIDNRNNFPNDRTFRMFCRQRDDFCEALRTWEGGRSTPGWSFAVVLGPRVKAILCPGNTMPEPTNFVHLARFFRAQLIANCGYGGAAGAEESMNAGEVVPLALRDADPEKLQRLQRRLVWPSRSRGGFCPLPTFVGTQEFFRDFIVFGANPMFNEHLKDCLISDILELNEMQFSASEFEEQDNKVDDDTRSEYIRCIVNLQLLAKFLGFLIFLPYQSESRLPDNILLSHCALRNKAMPVIDLLSLIKSARQLNRLSVTVPWMVVFLSMLDRVSANLGYYRDQLFPCLVLVYRQFALPNECSKSCRVPLTHAVLLIRLCLGWLFEQPNFPQETVFADESMSKAVEKYVIADGDQAIDKPTGPDNLDLINASLVHAICPFLSEFRLILIDSSNNKSGGSNIARHITPVAAPDTLTTLTTSRTIEMKLEENFFSNQPASLRRTVEFVSDRIASACVRHICSQLLPKALSQGLEKVHESVLEKMQTKTSDRSSAKSQPPDNFEVIMAREIRECSTEEWISLKKECLSYSDAECERRAWVALPPLLPCSKKQGKLADGEEVVSEAVMQMCIQVTSRTARQRVRRWLTSHTSPALFAKEYEVEVVKTLQASEKESKVRSTENNTTTPTTPPQIPLPSSHCEDAVPPSQLIIKLRDLILEVKETHLMALEKVNELMDEIMFSVQNRSDFTPPSLKTIFSLTVDLALFLVSSCSSGDILTKQGDWEMFISLWGILSPNSNDAFSHLLGPRNLFLLSYKDEVQRSINSKSTIYWPKRLSSLLSALLSANQLNSKQLEEQSLVVLRYSWSQRFLEKYSECIKGVLDHPQVARSQHYGDDDCISALMMEWLAESCATMESLD